MSLAVKRRNQLITKIISDENNIRIDAFLAKKVENISRAYISKLIQEEKVLLNGKPCKPSEKVQINSIIEMDIPPPEDSKAIPQDILLDVVYEDEWLAIINKPQGMVVHPASGHRNGTLVNALLYRFKGELSDINGVIRPGIVHRIDKDTSGLLLVVKQNGIHQQIAELIANHEIKRTYRAVVTGVIEEECGTIDAAIGRSMENRLKNAVKKEGKKAVSHFEVLKRYKNMTYVEVELETGRTHQIRVHFSYIHHSVLGDPLYGGIRKGYKLEGQALHAFRLEFIHPVTKENIRVEAPLPEKFSELLKQLDSES